MTGAAAASMPTSAGAIATARTDPDSPIASAPVTTSEPERTARRIGEVVLDVRNISLAFGGVKALTDISFDVREHEIRAIIGPNGAGKSSMLNCINGVYQPQQGSISLRGKTFRHMNSRQVAKMGVARTFQNLALFKGMSVLDNIMTGRNLQMRTNLLQQAIRWGAAEREESAQRRIVGPHAPARLALERDAAFLRMVEAVDDVEHRGLAGAVRADDGAHLALLDVEGHVADRAHAAEGERHVLHGQDHLTRRNVAFSRRPHAAFPIPGATGTVATSRTLTRAESVPLRPSSKVTSVEMSASFEPS